MNYYPPKNHTQNGTSSSRASFAGERSIGWRTRVPERETLSKVVWSASDNFFDRKFEFLVQFWPGIRTYLFSSRQFVFQRKKHQRLTPLLFFGWKFSNSIFLACKRYFCMGKTMRWSASSSGAPLAGERTNAGEDVLRRKTLWAVTRLHLTTFLITNSNFSCNFDLEYIPTFSPADNLFSNEKIAKGSLSCFLGENSQSQSFQLVGRFWHGKEDELVQIEFQSFVYCRTQPRLENATWKRNAFEGGVECVRQLFWWWIHIFHRIVNMKKKKKFEHDHLYYELRRRNINFASSTKENMRTL